VKNILIISHTFPPAPGIGGRRWAKFAKYLSRAGNKVYIITAENISQENSEWTHDVKLLEIEKLPYRFPKTLSNPVKNIFDKIKYHAAVNILSVLDTGNYYDKSIFWKEQIKKSISKYVTQKSIDTIIVTGGPFRLVYYVTGLKKKYPQITFISDFRDLWTEDLEISALSHMSSARINVEKKYETEAVNNSDWVLTVSESMKNYFSTLTSRDNCIVIPNGYDPEDFLDVNKTELNPELKQKQIRFVFAGTVYNNLEYILVPFFKAIKRLKHERPDLYVLFNFEFYGKFPKKYEKYVSEYDISEGVSILGQKPYDFVTKKVKEAHFGVLILNDLYNFSFSTKFCEYIGQQKKIVVVAKKGTTTDFVLNNDLGFHFEPSDPYPGLLKSMEFVIQNNFSIPLNAHFDQTVFSIEKITGDVEKYIGAKPQRTMEHINQLSKK
jgi:glycosyltransferase involved in cell wall biosynthesis